MSIAFLIGGKTDAAIWRGPMKFKVIQQFLSEVAWGIRITKWPIARQEPATNRSRSRS